MISDDVGGFIMGLGIVIFVAGVFFFMLDEEIGLGAVVIGIILAAIGFWIV